MLKFTAFRTQKPRQFNYIPRFYDPEKEAREERRKQVLGISDVDEGGEYTPGKYIRSNMRAKVQGQKKAKNNVLGWRITVLFALTGLSLWIWLDSLPVLIASLLVAFIAGRVLSK